MTNPEEYWGYLALVKNLYFCFSNNTTFVTNILKQFLTLKGTAASYPKTGYGFIWSDWGGGGGGGGGRHLICKQKYAYMGI
jgi:hypothetical protein